MTRVREWRADVEEQLNLLSAVFEQRFGYPFDGEDNFISDSAPGSEEFLSSLPGALAKFYREVGEVSLPDVGNGYFIHPIRRIADARKWGLPVRVDRGSVGEVLTFGSDGGGGYFCISYENGLVYFLPSGEIVSGIYSGGMLEPRVVAAGVDDFLQHLLVAVRTFVVSGQITEL